MSYWRYRAYNAKLEIIEGVIVGTGDSDRDCADILLKLRHNGLQVIQLDQIDSLVYQRELRVQKLKARMSPQPGVNSFGSKHEASPSIQSKLPGFLTRLVRRLL